MKGYVFAVMAAQILLITYALLGAKRTTFSLARMLFAIVPVGLICLSYRIAGQHAMLLAGGFSMFLVAAICDQNRDRTIAALVAAGMILFGLALAAYWLDLAVS